MPELRAGVGRTRITPWWGVELTGLGYYLGRTWTRIRDDLAATAIVIGDGARRVAWAAIDLMVIDKPFARRVREMVEKETGIPGDHVLIGCSHSHNAPAAGGLLGTGVCDPDYEAFAARQTATAIIKADRDRRPAAFAASCDRFPVLLYNRTRDDGPIEDHLTVLRVDDLSTGVPMAVVVNFQGHPTIQMSLGERDVSRDWPGQVVDRLEREFPGATGLFFMGSSGDLNIKNEFEAPERCHEPGEKIAATAIAMLRSARPVDGSEVAACRRDARLPTRRYPREEIERELAEARRRLATKNTAGWRESIGRVMVNRPDVFIANRYGGDELKGVSAMCRFSVEWIEQVLPDLDHRPEHLAAETQAFRIGDFFLVAQPSELFSQFSLDLRSAFGRPNLMVVGYANERIGYVPDAPDIAKRSYAAYQSPRYCFQFPFTEESGPALVEGMLACLAETANHQ